MNHDRIAVIDHGKMLAEGSLEELQRMVGGEEVVTLRGDFDGEAVLERLQASGGVRVLVREAERLVLATAATESGRGSMRLLSTLFAEGIAMESVAIEPPSLNSLFLELTGRELRDGCENIHPLIRNTEIHRSSGSGVKAHHFALKRHSILDRCSILLQKTALHPKMVLHVRRKRHSVLGSVLCSTTEMALYPKTAPRIRRK